MKCVYSHSHKRRMVLQAATVSAQQIVAILATLSSQFFDLPRYVVDLIIILNCGVNPIIFAAFSNDIRQFVYNIPTRRVARIRTSTSHQLQESQAFKVNSEDRISPD